MDSFDRTLLNIIQRNFPVTTKPYAVIASALHSREGQVMDRIAALKEKGVIRQISAIFDPPSVGYQTCLAAMAIDKGQIEHAARIINRESGVSHNYLREDEFNMWFTIAVPPGQEVHTKIERLGVAASARKIIILPAVKLYKIAVVMDVGGRGKAEPEKGVEKKDEEIYAPEASLPGMEDIRIIRCIQEDLPLINRPFGYWARDILLEEGYLIDWIRSRLEGGVIRRFAALVRHRKVGFLANAMVAWECPVETIDRQGQFLASQSEVTHCYQRMPSPGWPYNLYAMVHGKNRAACDQVIERLVSASGLPAFKVLYSIKELKKERLKLFRDNLG